MLVAMNSGLAPKWEELTKAPLLTLIGHYLEYYADGASHTARAKRLDLDCFVKFLTHYKGVSKPEKLLASEWDATAVQQFVDSRLEQGEAPSTVARRLATLKHMGRTLSERIAGFINPAREVKSPKIQITKPKHLKAEEIEHARSKAQGRLSEKHSFNRFRNQILFELLLDTGLRAEEVRLLRRGQLDDSLEWIKNVRTKGRRYRNVYITSTMRDRLIAYLDKRSEKLKEVFGSIKPADDRALPIFISTYNARIDQPDSLLMGAKSIWRAINELSAETELHPHLLRHSYAIDLLEESNDVRLVAQALGHSDVRITMRYTERHEEQLAATLERSRKKIRSDENHSA